MPSLEELKKLENFDLELYNRNPNYRKMVDDSARIKANADQVIRDNPEATSTAEQLMQDPKFTKVEEQPQPQIQEQKLIPAKPNDFTFQDFIAQERFDNNSPITKTLQGNKNVPTDAMWTDRSLLTKYWASKKHFKIKIAGENKFNEYTFQPVNDDQLKELRQMVEDVNNFYALVTFEKKFYDDIDGLKKPALFRSGKYYTKVSDIESDYRKAVSFICLGIPEEEFNTLEQFSDPDFTINDIWGIYDLIEGLHLKAEKGGSYFRIAYKL